MRNASELQKDLDKAIKLLEEGKDFQTAEEIFNNFLNIDMESPVIIFYLASCAMRKQQFALARHLFLLSLQYDGASQNAAPVWNNYGYASKELMREEDATNAFQKAIDLYPHEPDFWANLGCMSVGQGRPNKALKSLEKAIELNPNHLMARWNRSLALLEKGEWEEGFNEYTISYCHNEKQKDRFYDNTPEWDGSFGKTVIVYGEQGIGDELMFASLLPLLSERKITVILDAHPRLADIFRHSFPNMHVYGTRKDNTLYWPCVYDPGTIDARIRISALPKFLIKSKEDFYQAPYLAPDFNLVKKYKEKLAALGDKPKIGISWKGGTKNTGLKHRTMKLKDWLPLFKNFDADYISLQYTSEAASHVEKFKEEFGITIHHWQETIDDYDETAALVSELDLIISVPQSVVHLAGGLGIPTYQLTPMRAIWQMGVYGEDLPWYAGRVKSIWQKQAGDWAGVIEEVKEKLCNL